LVEQGLNRLQVIVRDHLAARQEWLEAAPEILTTIDRKNPKSQPMESMVDVDNARPFGGGARKF
jgi:hypothetical protein